jgi:hypothetical protein
LTTFIFGAIGALAPEAVRAYKSRLEPFRVPVSYWLISLIYLAVAGAAALVLAAPDSKYSAFYIGLTLPVTLGAVARGKTSSQSAHDHRDDVEEIDPRDLGNAKISVYRFLTLV